MHRCPEVPLEKKVIINLLEISSVLNDLPQINMSPHSP